MSEGDSDEKQQFNVYLSADLVKAIKHLSIERGQRLSRMVEEILRDYLEREGREKQ